jgi:hypothetical protein
VENVNFIIGKPIHIKFPKMGPNFVQYGANCDVSLAYGLNIP